MNVPHAAVALTQEPDRSDANVLRISRRYFTRSDQHISARRQKNRENWDAYRGEQDWSHKAPYQSREVTPTFAIAIDQIVGTFERALTDSSDWLLAEAPGAGTPFLEPDVIAGVLRFYLSRLWRPGNHAETAYGIQVLVGDAVKRGIMEPRIVAKVFPVLLKRRHYRLKKSEPKKPGSYTAYEFVGKELESVDVETMRLCVELLDWDSYLPDPSPACRYEIHKTRRHISELLANPEYDQDVVRKLLGRANEEWERQDQARARGERSVGPDPFEIIVYEAWGDIIDERTGEVLHENVFWTWAGDELIRKPTPNPFWDGTRPFIVASIIRVPGSNEHKALADLAVSMWRAQNELVNLFLDGAMRAAWGVGQVRPDIMESPEEIADGIPQGYTAVLKPNQPQGLKFYERVDNGEAPPVTLEGLRQLDGFLQEALAMPDTKLGQIPHRRTTATEAVQALQSSGSLYESFAARFEDTFLEPLFEKCWKLIIQYADSFIEEELIQVLGPTNALRLEDLSAAERWKLLHKASFKVRGLRGLAAKERTFNKQMQILTLLSSNQQFADFFGQNYDYTKFFNDLIRNSGSSPEMWALEQPIEEEIDTSGTIAGGQLDANLPGSTGASQPNLGAAEGAQGVQSALAPNNPAGGAAVSGI